MVNSHYFVKEPHLPDLANLHCEEEAERVMEAKNGLSDWVVLF